MPARGAFEYSCDTARYLGLKISFFLSFAEVVFCLVYVHDGFPSGSPLFEMRAGGLSPAFLFVSLLFDLYFFYIFFFSF